MRQQRLSFPLEIAAVWALFCLVAVEILVTYSRLPAGELYHVSGSGLEGGASRALVFLNFPLALVAIAIAALVADFLEDRALTIVSAVGVALSAALFWPGMVKQSNLDARSVNAIAACGVSVAAVLTVVAAKWLSRPKFAVRQPGDALRVVVAAVALILAIPWMTADLGLSFNGVPLLGTLYQTGELRSQPSKAASPDDRYLTDVPSRLVENPAPGDAPHPDAVVLHPAVHHGHHHGMDGVLLVLTALLLSRVVGWVRRGWLAGMLGAYLALMFSYGAGNVANDFWLEQVVKRGWTNWEIPDVTTPKPSPAWGVIVASAVAIFAVSVWRDRRARPAPGRTSPETA